MFFSASKLVKCSACQIYFFNNNKDKQKNKPTKNQIIGDKLARKKSFGGLREMRGIYRTNSDVIFYCFDEITVDIHPLSDTFLIMSASYFCPICSSILCVKLGTRINPRDGVTLYCPNSNTPECIAQEVEGHGLNAEQAYRVIQTKYYLDKPLDTNLVKEVKVEPQPKKVVEAKPKLDILQTIPDTAEVVGTSHKRGRKPKLVPCEICGTPIYTSLKIKNKGLCDACKKAK